MNFSIERIVDQSAVNQSDSATRFSAFQYTSQFVRYRRNWQFTNPAELARRREWGFPSASDGIEAPPGSPRRAQKPTFT
ncbi:MAG: hypothetical protein AAF989_15220, partial [Planctomycetota bacterium]